MPYSDFSFYDKWGEMPLKKRNEPNDWFDHHILPLTQKGLVVTNGYIVEITPNNSKKIEDDIKNNPDYSFDLLSICFAAWGGAKGFPKNDKEKVRDLLRIIDLKNSTNLWRMKHEHRQALVNMAAYIADPVNNFWGKLPNPANDLVEELVRVGSAKGVEAKSFASKACKYIDCLYGGNAYYINDAVVRRVLPFYLNYYKVQVDVDAYKGKKKARGSAYYKYDFDAMPYPELFKCLDALKQKVDSKGKLTKTKFDHILWYSYRQEKD